MNKYFKTMVLVALITGPSAVSAETTNRELGLNEAVKEALQNNLNLTLQKEDSSIAEGQSEAAKGKFDTFIGADIGLQDETFTPIATGGAENESSSAWNAKVQKMFSPGTEVALNWNNGWLDTDQNGLLISPIYSQSLTLGISQPLLNGFGSDNQTADLQASQKNYEASSYLVDSEAADLAAEVKKSYWNLVYAWQDIEVKRLSLELAQKLLEETREKINAGKLADIELYRPESEVARREEDLISAERAIGAAEDYIKLLLNSEDWLASYTPTDLPDITYNEPDLQEVGEIALTHRPDIKAADLYIEAADLQKNSAKNATLPSLDLMGKIGVGGTADKYDDSTSNTFEGEDTVWQVGLTFSVPINNSYAKGQYLQAKASHRKAQTSAMLLRQQVRQVVRTTVRDVNLAHKALEATSKTAFATKKGLEAEGVKFDAGRATTLDVLIAQESYSTALSQENRTKILYAQSLAELDRIQGKITLDGKPIEY